MRFFKSVTVALGAILVACTGSKANDSAGAQGGMPVSTKVKGVAQKGPFVNGSSVTVSELDADLIQTGRTFQSTIKDDTGSFSVPGVELQTPFARIGVDGFYFDEARDALSDSRVALFSYADLSDAATINVNLLGHLEAGRIEYLVQEQGAPFVDAKAQAHVDVLHIFTLEATTVEAAETLDIGVDGAGNAALLALSIITQGSQTVGELTELLSSIQTDIRTDGVLDSATLGSALMNNARILNPVKVRENLEARFEILGSAATVPAFETYLEKFIADAPYEFTGGIQYPADGARPNVLDKTLTAFESGISFPNYGFAAELPAATELVVRMTRTSGIDVWGYAGIQGLNWNVTLWDGGADSSQTFTAAHDGFLDFESFEFLGTGAATMEYFEYGSATPTFSKEVTWAPAAP